MVGKNIKKVREEKGLTQDALAERLNVTRQAVSNWENEKTQPDIDMLQKIAFVLKITVNELMNEEYLQMSERADDSSTEVFIPDNFSDLKKIKTKLIDGKAIVLRFETFDQMVFDYMRKELILTPENHRSIDKQEGERDSYLYIILPHRQTRSELGFNGIEVSSPKIIADLRSIKTVLENDGKVIIVEFREPNSIVLDYLREESIVTAKNNIMALGKHSFLVTAG